MSTPVRIVNYNPCWPDRFTEARTFFLRVLGETVHSIHHIGSTSVPGLESKDRIDVQITLRDPSIVPALQAALTEAGLPQAEPNRDHRPAGDSSPDQDWEKLYLRGVDLGFAMNVHLRFLGRQNREYPILFRDFLRKHPGSATAYGHFKRGLAAAIGEDRDLYCDLKDPVCDLILHQARDWAKRTNWSASPS